MTFINFPYFCLNVQRKIQEVLFSAYFFWKTLFIICKYHITADIIFTGQFFKLLNEFFNRPKSS